MSWLCVVNPSAGGGRERNLPSRVDRVLREHGISADLVVTESAGHLRTTVTEAARSGRTDFIAVGGDGTVNLVVDSLMHEVGESMAPRVGILPAGTGCDLIRTFGIPQTLEGAAPHLTGDTDYVIDVGFIDGAFGRRYFANVAEAGLGAAVVAAADRYPRRLGAARYKLAIWPTLVRFPPADIVLTTERRTYEGQAIMVVFANAQFFGGGMNIAPKATLVDGALDCQVFSGPKRLAVTLQPRIQRGTHLGHTAVTRMRAGSFRLDVRDDWPVEVDGEYVGTGPFHGGVVPGALRIKI